MATKAASREKKSKVEVEEEFENIKEQSLEEKREVNPKTEEQIKRWEGEIKEVVKDTSVESITQKISGLGLEVTKALSEISIKLSAETTLLNSLREAVVLEHKELERLHKIDVAASALDQLIKEYDERKVKQETEISELRMNWTAEQENREREQKEFEENLK